MSPRSSPISMPADLGQAGRREHRGRRRPALAPTPASSGISSSRGLGGELRNRLLAKSYELDEAIKSLHIKVSGCFNSCGCHHVADLGFYGVSRTINGYKVPHFQVVLGGQWEHNAGSYGLPIIAIPSKRAPEAVDRITGHYVQNRQKDENFYAFVKRVGKGPIRDLLEPLNQNLPSHDAEPGLYSDWGDPRQYSIGDIGVGECAGEVVSRYQFEMTAAERLVFEAGLELDRGAAAARRRDRLCGLHPRRPGARAGPVRRRLQRAR